MSAKIGPRADDADSSLCRINITPRLPNTARHEDSAKHKRQENSFFLFKGMMTSKRRRYSTWPCYKLSQPIMAVNRKGEIMVNKKAASVAQD